MPKVKSKILLPFNPKGNVFRWGPVQGKFFYCSVFTEVHYKYFRKKYGENWPETLFLFKNGRMVWLNNSKDIEKDGRRVFIRYLLPKLRRKKIYAEWQEYVKLLNELYKKIDLSNLSRVSHSTLLKLWNDFHNLYIKFWVSGSIPELSNYGSIAYLEKKLLAHISGENERASVLEALTAPARLSFYQKEEIDLSKARDIAEHQKRYFWLKNSYAGTEVLTTIFFKNRKKFLARNLEKKIAKKFVRIARRKREIQKKYKFSKEILDAAEAIISGVAWQDERKKHILIALHYIDALAKEIARRFGYKFTDFDNLWYFEVADIIKGKKFYKKIKERQAGFGVQFFHTCKELSPQETSFIWRAYEVKHTNQEQIEVKGIIASKGNGKKLSGHVHILLDPLQARSFKQGEILVAPMTSPEYIFAMRKASAILTDTGGLTSHAAIVCRELGVPCLVGTKLSTKIFKNGDLVEINPKRGTAKKIT